jgi:hypothetical protein
MKQRCYDRNADNFHHYGGRGVTVCDWWRFDYANFLRDVERKPSPKHSLDRIDNAGNYDCGHCVDCWRRGVMKPNVQWAFRTGQSALACRALRSCAA